MTTQDPQFMCLKFMSMKIGFWALSMEAKVLASVEQLRHDQVASDSDGRPIEFDELMVLFHRYVKFVLRVVSPKFQW